VIEINLLPSGDKRRTPSARSGGARTLPPLPRFGGDPFNAMLAVVGIVVFLGLAFAYWRTDDRQTLLASELDVEVADSVRFAATIELLDAVRARQDTINQKIEVIRGVDSRRYVWPHLLDEISRATPAFTWLNKVSSTEAAAPAAQAPADSTAPPPVPEGPAFTLEGNAGSTQALTRFMKSLEQSPFIRDVTLVTSEQVSEEGRTFQKFTLEARYQSPDSAFVQTVPVISLP
jgi:Tfp pilus assembly protein PilN